MDWPRFWQDPPEIMVRHPPFPGPPQTLIAAKDGSNLIKFHTPQGCVQMEPENAVSLAAIRLGKRVVWRVDGLAAISAGPPRNHGPHPTFPLAHHSGRNRS